MKHKFLRLTLVSATLALGAVHLDAQEYQGATAALQQILAPKPPPRLEPNRNEDPISRLRQELSAFREKSATLSPPQAAQGWLALADRSLAVIKASARQDNSHQQRFEFRETLGALPPPAAWDALADAILARPPAQAKQTPTSISLRLLAHTLKGDRDAPWKEVAALQALVAREAEDGQQNLAAHVVEISDALTKQSQDPARRLAALNLRLAMQSYERQNLELPDLVAQYGPEKSAQLLQRILTTYNGPISIQNGEATLKLAQKLAREQVAKLKYPQWGLVNRPEATALYEALEKRYIGPKPKGANAALTEALSSSGDNYSHPQARLVYLAGLILSGQTQKAVQVATEIRSTQAGNPFDEHGMNDIARITPTKAAADFFHDLLARNPNMPFWDAYISSATQTGQAERMVALIRKATDDQNLKADRRRVLQQALYKALIATDQIEEGVAVLRQLLTRAENVRDNTSSDLGVELARIGYHVNRNDWIEEGLRFAKAGSREFTSSRGLVSLLIEMGRGPEAEKVLIEALARAPGEDARIRGEWGGEETLQVLMMLADLYHGSGRHADVLILLRDAPQWMATDLSDVFLLASFEKDTPLGFMAASALARTGRKDEALKMVEALLYDKAGFDPAYELLLELKGQEALPLLETLARRNRFEERPLLWKAQLLLQAGRLDDAEKTAKEAIAIDPSDGGEPYGRRMRVYTVLADIYAAKGDAGKATFYREVVRAIRMGERADDLYIAGLLQRGIALYKDALTHFADAYCIQSRLAIQLAEAGRIKEAEEHYRRAYELMPDSFGRMASHCFG